MKLRVALSKKRLQPLLVWVALLISSSVFAAQPTNRFAVNISVDAGRPGSPLPRIWRFFGADEPNYAYMKDGRKLLGELGRLAPREVYFRAHNLLTSGDGTPALKWGSTGAYREDGSGQPVYDWTILDRIFDSYLQNGVRPYVEIGFMPQALSIHPEPYQHQWQPGVSYDRVFTGWAYPPKDYDKWGNLVFEWVRHCVAIYGRAEVERWYWEVWNEPNIGYWRGTPEEFLKLHDYAIAGVRRALPSATVGGPDTAGGGGKFLMQFLEHCLRGTNYATGRTGTPLDFVAFHAKGAPRFVEGRVQMGIANQLRTIDAAFAAIAAYPELKSVPVIIGESDPDGCAACQGPELAYRNGTLYSSYTAASFARKLDLAERHGVHLEGALTWAFEFENQPYFAGFRVLASNGLDLPVLNVFRMFSQMSGRRVPAQSSAGVPLPTILERGVRAEPDIAALASLETNRLWVLVWHYHDDDVAGPEANIKVEIAGLPVEVERVALTQFRIDADHGNVFTAWQRLGSPAQPNASQYAQLEQAARLEPLGSPETLPIKQQHLSLELDLARQAVALLVFEWAGRH